MTTKSTRRKNINSILQTYYNVNDNDENKKSFEVQKNPGEAKKNSLGEPKESKNECDMKRSMDRKDRSVLKADNTHGISNETYEKDLINNNTKIISTSMKKEWVTSTEFQSKKSEECETYEMEEEKDELDVKCSEFNVNRYFKKLLETSTLEDLINKSKKIEKEIKQNDCFMQSLVYENYSKFIEATDIIVNLKKSFKDVKEHIQDINDCMKGIDEKTDSINAKVSRNFEKIENMLEIKRLLHEVNEIMNIPKKMLSYIIQKNYIEALKVFIKVLPFLEDHKDIQSFHNLYLDCSNMANIASYFFLKKLNTEESSEQLPNESETPFFFEKNAKECFHLLGSYVTPSEEIVSCLRLILIYGKNKQKIRKLYIQNRMSALKYLLFQIFTIPNYIRDINILTTDYFMLHQINEKKEIGLKEKEELRELTCNKIFELAFHFLIKFFFRIIQNYEQIFQNDSFSDYPNFISMKEKEEKVQIEKYTFVNENIEESTKRPDNVSDTSNTTENIDIDIHYTNPRLQIILEEGNDEKIIETMMKGFFKSLLHFTIETIYMFNPSINLIVDILKKLLMNVQKYQLKKYTTLTAIIMNDFVKQIYYITLKYSFFQIFQSSNKVIDEFVNDCNHQEYCNLLEKKDTLIHNMLMQVCSVLVDLEEFSSKIKINSRVFPKLLLNFIIYYIMFLLNIANHYIQNFICIYETGVIEKNNKTDTNPIEKEPIYDEGIILNKSNSFKYKNIYFFTYNEKPKEPEIKEDMENYELLFDYLLEGTHSKSESQKFLHLKKMSSYIKMKPEEFMEELVSKEAYKISKIRKIYVLLSLVCVFSFFKKEGINKIVAIMRDLYPSVRPYLSEKKNVLLIGSLNEFIYKDVLFPLVKTDKAINNEKEELFYNFDNTSLLRDKEKNETKKLMNKKSKIDINCGIIKKNQNKLKENIFPMENKEIVKKQEKEDLHDEEELKKNTTEDIPCTPNNRVSLNEFLSNSTGRKITFSYSDDITSENENDYEQDNNSSHKNNEEVTSPFELSKFAKYKLHEQCNELISVFIFYYINKISHNMKMFIEGESWILSEKTELVSEHLLSFLKEINHIYVMLSQFFHNNSTGKMKNKSVNEHSYQKEKFDEMLYNRMEKELEQVCKKQSKEKNAFHQSDKELYENNQNSTNIIQKDTNQKSLEMYMYKLYMHKMKNYKKNIQLENNKIVFIILKVLFKNYTEYIRNCYFDENGFYKLRVDFFFYYHCLKIYIPSDDENIFFVVLNEVLINAKERMVNMNDASKGLCIGMGSLNKLDSKSPLHSRSHYNSLYHVYLLDHLEIDLEKNKNYILKSLKES